MVRMIRRGMLAGALLLLPMLAARVPRVTAAQLSSGQAAATTQVSDTVYFANGTPASGTVLISWNAFTSPSGLSIPAGSTSVTLAANGGLSVALVPNAGASPVGSYYTVVYHLSDGTVTREYWVIPASGTAVSLNAIRSSVLPTTVAMQTVSKAYVDTAIAAAVTGHPLATTSPYVLVAGDTMTGPLVLPGDPTAPLQAADKNYVDNSTAGVTSGLAQKVSTVPAATQVVTQPTGTQLDVNLLNGAEYASRYVAGRGNNGIANAVASPDCANGCEIVADPGYSGSNELYQTAALPSGTTGGTHLQDDRNGERRDSYFNPTDLLQSGADAGQVIDVASTRSAASVFQRTSALAPASVGLLITHEGLAGGSNLFPESIEPSVPYFKSSYSALSVIGTYNTLGQHVLNPRSVSCYGVGDCLVGSQSLTASGGFRDSADEGAHPFDLQIQEDSNVFQGTCTTGCSAGSTSLNITPTSAPGTQGEGRYLIDKNPAGVLTAGSLTGSSTGVPGPGAVFTGTSFPVSVFLQTAQTLPSQANNIAPGLVTFAIAASGLPTGFVGSTSALPASSGVACVADVPNVYAPTNFEMATYTVVDSTHLQMTLNKPHATGATIAVGGLCGYGLEQTVDTSQGIRQVFPVIGSYSANGLYYAGHLTPVVGQNFTTSGYFSTSLPIASIARSGNVVTLTTAGNFPVDLNGLSLTVAGVSDSTYNGTFAVTTTGPNSLTYTATGANGSSSGGTLAMTTGGYALYPMAEVLGVFNAATAKVDGLMTLAPNTVHWAANDPVEEPHYFQESVTADTEFVTQVTPRPSVLIRAGVQYQGNVGAGMIGWTVKNAAPLTNYFGHGGTHAVPNIAYEATGAWQRTFSGQAGDQAAFALHCNSHGCGSWNSGYNLFELDSNVGVDTVTYQPQTSTLTYTLRGTAYTLTPQSMTAGVVNATTLNATTINAGTVTGTISASSLPVFGASGAGHAAGVVPDPGATAGNTRYLREDGTWSAPAGGATGSGVGKLPTGAMADYNFLQGSGTVLADNSGNGNNGTLSSGTLAPTWTPTGLAFSGLQSVQLPAALNTAQTFCAAAYITPLGNGTVPTNQYPVLVSSSLGGNGVNLMYAKNGAGYLYAFAPDIYAGNQHRLQSPNLVSGFHVLCYVLGTGSGNLDHAYVDGNEVSYTTQSWSYGQQSSGYYLLGSSGTGPFTASGFTGTLYRFAAYPTQLTAAMVAAVSGAMQADVATRGVPTAPVPVTQTVPLLLASGTSITSAAGLTPSQSWVANLSLVNQPAYTVVNSGIIGITVDAINGSEANRAGPYCRSTSGPSVYVLLGGDNDFGVYSTATAASVFGSIAGTVQQMKQAGCKVFVGTILSRSGNGATGASFDSFKDALDPLILSQAKAVGADGVIDFAANPLLGADGANTNTTYFQSDHTHPTAAGQLLLASAANNALNYAFGYNESNPHTVAALPYSMAAGDGSVSLQGLAGSGTLTLPDCTGQSGAVYRVVNPQSTYTVTVAPLNSGQPINGLSTVTVPANGTLQLRDVPNPKNVSGCHWEM
ncbi:MAG: hypothetical protein KGK08_04590 [Acidobacteriota bacterium]|nr:hypothetical protein [Acidobacteriota bacterium]